MEFDEFSFHFYRDPNDPSIYFLFVTDIEEEKNEITFKIRKIANIFNEKYSEILENFNGNISRFDSFGTMLIEMKLAQKNCGGHSECIGCPNSDLDSRILRAFLDSQK
jgi:hypothetical protein